MLNLRTVFPFKPGGWSRIFLIVGSRLEAGQAPATASVLRTQHRGLCSRDDAQRNSLTSNPKSAFPAEEIFHLSMTASDSPSSYPSASQTTLTEGEQKVSQPSQSHGSDSRQTPVQTQDERASENFDDLNENQTFLSTSNSPKRWIVECERRLYLWNKQMVEAQNAGKPLKLSNVVSMKFPTVVNLSLKLSAPPVLRRQCLGLLLTEKEDDILMQKLLLQTVQDVYHLPIKVVGEIVQSLSSSHETELRKSSRRQLVAAVINKRWYELNPKHLMFFMYQLDELFNMRSIIYNLRQRSKSRGSLDLLEGAKEEKVEEKNKTSQDEPDRTEEAVSAFEELPVSVENVEARAIALVDELKVKDLSRIVSLMAKWRSRNQILLQAVLHRLSQSDVTNFSAVQMSNVLFACSVLRLRNGDFLQKLCAQFLAAGEPSSPALACSVLASCSHLGWRDINLISKCLNCLGGHVTNLSPKEALSVISALSHLYILPATEDEKSLVKGLASRAMADQSNPIAQVSAIWSLAVLRSMETSAAAAVLHENVVEQFAKCEMFKQQLCIEKLKDVELAACNELLDYPGPVLPENLSKTESPTRCDPKMQSALLIVLRKFVDLSTYVSVVEPLPASCCVGAVMCANSEGDVRPLVKHSAKEEQSELSYKIALQLVPFGGVTAPDEVTTGSFQFSARILSHLGYIPVQILYSDLRPSKTVLEQVNCIQGKVKAAVKERSS